MSSLLKFIRVVTVCLVHMNCSAVVQGFIDPHENEFVNSAGITELKVGFISPQAGILGYDTIASASTMAITDAQDYGYLPGINVT